MTQSGGQTARLRALHITTWYPRRDDDPTGTFVREHVRAAQRFAEGSVLHIAWNDADLDGRYQLEELTASDGPPVVRLRVGSGRSRGAWLVVGLGRALARHVAKHGRPDIIHTHTLPSTVLGALVARLFRRPHVATEHWTGLLRGGRGHAFVRAMVARFAFRSTATVMPVGPALAEGIRALAGRTPIQIVPNVVDTAVFRADDRGHRGSHRVLLIGNLIERKRPDLAVRSIEQALLQVPDLELVVLGSGPEHAELERLASDLNLQDAVRLEGAVTKPVVADWLRRSGLLLITSAHETFSVVAAEAMCCGVPVVTTACGGPEFLVDRSSGIVVASPSVESFSAAIVEALSVRWDHAAISHSAHDRFSVAAVASQLERVYVSVISD